MPHKRAKKSVREQQRKGRGADLAPPGDNSGNGTSISTERVPKSAARVLDAARIRAEYKQKKHARMQMEGGATDANDDHDHNHTGGAPKPPPHKKRRTNAGPGAGAEKCRVSNTKGKEHHHLVDTQAIIEIQPGESLKHFNRRVEDHMRPLVQSAMRASATTERKERKAAVVPSASHTSTTAAAAAATATKKASVKDALSTTARRDNADDGDNDDDHRPKEFAVMSSAAPRRLNDVAMAPPQLKKFPRGVKTKHNSPAAGSGEKTKAGAAAGAGVLSMAQRVMMEAERESAIKRYREMKERKTMEADRTLLSTV